MPWRQPLILDSDEYRSLKPNPAALDLMGAIALVPLATATASTSATVDFVLTSPPNSDFFAYLVTLANVLPATDNTVFQMRTSTNGGSNYSAGASDYKWTNLRGDGATFTGSNDAADDAIDMTLASSNAANEGMSGIVLIFYPSSANYCRILSNLNFDNVGSVQVLSWTAGTRLAAADVDAIRFLFSSGNIASGEFRLYGLKNAF